VYPKEMTKLEQVLETRDLSIDTEDGHSIAYIAILQASQGFENPPVFMKEDHPAITSDPQLAKLVPGWMNTAAKVASGNRRRVLENGRDVMNSDDEDAIEDVKPDEELNMYTAGMDPTKGPVLLSQRQVAAQKGGAAALAQQQAAEKAPPRSQTSVSGSSDDDDPNGPELIWSQSKHFWRPNKNCRKAATAEPQRQPAPSGMPVNSASQAKGPSRPPTPVGAPTETTNTAPKAAAPQKAPAEPKPTKGAKASHPTPPKGQESPETKVSTPMETRRQAKEASGAGGLRGVVGSGSTGHVCNKLSPSSKPGS
jgi:hypothetical protein